MPAWPETFGEEGGSEKKIYNRRSLMKESKNGRSAFGEIEKKWRGKCPGLR